MTKYKANFLWPHKDGGVEEMGYEFANAKTEEYRRECWNELMQRVKNCAIADVSDFTFQDIIEAAKYGFNYANEVKHEGNVPIGNILQKVMADKHMRSIPPEWLEYLQANGYDR